MQAPRGPSEKDTILAACSCGQEAAAAGMRLHPLAMYSTAEQDAVRSALALLDLALLTGTR
jgi:hypothetical protein